MFYNYHVTIPDFKHVLLYNYTIGQYVYSLIYLKMYTFIIFACDSNHMFLSLVFLCS